MGDLSMPSPQHLKLQGQVPHGGKKPKQALPDRVCKVDGCTKILSVYNLHLVCWYHTPIKIPRLRGRKNI